MHKQIPPWLWTLLVSTIAGALVAGASVIFSRRDDHFAEKPPGNRVDDSFRQTVRRVGAMEGLWQTALESAASRMLETGSRDVDPPVAGVVQSSWLNPAFSDPARSHRRGDGREVSLKPVLARFARKGDSSEWVLEESLIHGSGWIEQSGKPLAWRQGNGKTAVVLLLDPLAAARTVQLDLGERADLHLPEDEPGSLGWTGPGGTVFLQTGTPAPTAKPDEILRHVSRFGDWTLRRYYPVRVVTRYRLPVLAGGFTLAALLAGGGIAIASWQRKATRLAEQRVSFVNRVSHELRTPLTNLLLNTDLALDGLPAEDGKVRRRLRLIREETARLSRIVDNVQVFARMEHGQPVVRQAPCDVGKRVHELQENFAPLFGRKSISCEFDCRVSGEIPIDGDALFQILSNLLSNVEKYAGEAAKASVVVACDSGDLVITVNDNGPGIPAEARRRIFLPFERVGSRVDEGATGTGLGLAISRELAGQMGGRLDLRPTSRGAEFRLLIPFQERTPA